MHLCERYVCRDWNIQDYYHNERSKLFCLSSLVSIEIEGLDTSKIVYEVSKIWGILETSNRSPKVSRDVEGFWRIPGIIENSRDS